tara:strand:+ start:5920 stop:6147 length:228 start_codon:yes stop_codon:yes gene_type:complete
MKTPEEAFGIVLRRLRKQKGISQERLALEGNLDRTFISMLERGKRQPSLTTILNLAIVLGVGEGELVELVVKEIG